LVHIRIDPFFFRLYALREGASKPEFVGSAFPVTPGCGLLTCRHVADVGAAKLFVHDNIAGRLIPIAERRFSGRPDLDLAFLQAGTSAGNHSFLPLLSPSVLQVGESVYSYGFFMLAGSGEVEQGYFSGRIVNLSKTPGSVPVWSLTLPYPIIEGMSGSPVLTYHNGPKVVGLGFGNRSTRILASEVLEYEDRERKVREEINRIVEFGLAYHVSTLIEFLAEVGAESYVVTDQHVANDDF
jgi:trypsin-like peptidase